jgi:hypothetical protein
MRGALPPRPRSATPIVALGIVTAVAVLGWLFILLTSYRVPVFSYRVADDRTVTLQVVGGDTTWCRVAEKTETAAEVRFRALCTDFIFLGFLVGARMDGIRADIRMDLDAPLGDRILRDTVSGQVISLALPTPPGFSSVPAVLSRAHPADT